jgi:hypothetical protein
MGALFDLYGTVVNYGACTLVRGSGTPQIALDIDTHSALRQAVHIEIFAA